MRRAFRRYVLDVLGFDPKNVLDLRDTTRSEMETVFGKEHDHRGNAVALPASTRGLRCRGILFGAWGFTGRADKRKIDFPASALYPSERSGKTDSKGQVRETRVNVQTIFRKGKPPCLTPRC